LVKTEKALHVFREAMENERYRREDIQAPAECCCPSPIQQSAHTSPFEDVDDDTSEIDARSPPVLAASDKDFKEPSIGRPNIQEDKEAQTETPVMDSTLEHQSGHVSQRSVEDKFDVKMARLEKVLLKATWLLEMLLLRSQDMEESNESNRSEVERNTTLEFETEADAKDTMLKSSKPELIYRY
jgi:hypothetical protein